MRHLGKVALMVTLLASVVGCISYEAFISTTPKLGSQRGLTAQELDSLRDAIREKLATMGMIEHPRLEWRKKVNEESPESEYKVFDSYIVGPDADTNGSVEVWVLQGKKDGTIIVLIQVRSWFMATRFTKALQAGLEDVLATQFPGSTVTHRIERPLMVP